MLAFVSLGLNYFGTKAIIAYIIAIVLLVAVALYTRSSAVRR